MGAGGAPLLLVDVSSPWSCKEGLSRSGASRCAGVRYIFLVPWLGKRTGTEVASLKEAFLGLGGGAILPVPPRYSSKCKQASK